MFDDTVAMNSERRSMCVGMIDSGFSVDLSLDLLAVASCVISPLLSRGTAVVELSRISNVFNPQPSRFLVVVTHRHAGPPNLG